MQFRLLAILALAGVLTACGGGDGGSDSGSDDSSDRVSITATGSSDEDFDDPTQAPGPQNPPPAGLWKPAAGATPATGNFVYLQSEPGDYIGQGRTLLFTADNATFESGTLTREFIVGLHSAGTAWSAHFDHMSSIPRLQPGYYPDVARLLLHNPTRGGMDVNGEGRSCEVVGGWFVIDSVTYTGTEVTAIDLTFEQHCNNAAAALRGRIRWNQ